MSKRRLPHTFPHRIVFTASLILCLCAVASLVLAVLSWTNRLWGYYWGTGFWSGGVVLLTGIHGIVCSYVRNICSVKSFMISSIFGCLVSLGMLALSAGGLDPGSGFYNGIKGHESLNQICHGGSLGLGVLQLGLCILADGICIHYLFIERNAQLYTVKNGDNSKKRKHRSGNRNSLNSTRSDTPFIDGSSQSKGKKKSKVNTKEPNVSMRHSSTRDPVGSLRKNGNGSASSPTRSPCVRSASFSTFGHSDVASDRLSLIVHPGDNMSVAETIRSQTPDIRSSNECHYAQTTLFEPPLPIEEDDELPPYEAVDSQPYANIDTQVNVSPNTEFGSNRNLRRSNSAPSQNRRRSERKGNRRSLAGSQIPHGKKEDRAMHSRPKCEFNSNTMCEPQSKHSPVRSRSVDLMSANDGSPFSNHDLHEQGVAYRDFAHSSDRILSSGVNLTANRSQSLKFNREKRLDRRQRALSAEIKLNKDQILIQGSTGHLNGGLGHRTNSIDGSSSGLFASNRAIPTKFSLRTPVRQIGMPHVRSAVPVKSITTLPLFSPPAKPPRTFSVTLKDFDFGDIPSVQLDECVFMDEPDCIYSECEPKMKDGVENTECVNKTASSDETNNKTITEVKSENSITFEKIKADKPNQETKISIESGPVLKCMFVPPGGKPDSPGYVEGKTKDVSEQNNNSDISPELTMALPSSPIMKRPLNEEVASEPNSLLETIPIYAEVGKKTDNAPKPRVRKSRQLTNSVSISETASPDTSGKDTKTLEYEHTFEDKVVLSVQEPCQKATESTTTVYKNEKTNANVELLRDLRVRLPPLSPSERILQRKNSSPPIRNDNADMHDSGVQLLKSEKDTADNNISIGNNGARPKVYRNLKTGPQLSAIPVPTKRSSVSNVEKDDIQKSTDKHTTSEKSSDVRRTALTPSKPAAFKTSPQQSNPSPLMSKSSHSPSTLQSGPVVLRPGERSTASRSLTNNTPASLSSNVPNKLSNGAQVVPSNSVPNALAGSFHNILPNSVPMRQNVPPPTAAASQGVLHLPQSQYSRHVTENGQHNAPSSVQAQANVQNNAPLPNMAQQNNSNGPPNRPLFSVLL